MMAAACAMGIFSSCSNGGSDAIAENIPASAVMVMKFNPQQIIESTGCSVDNGKIVLSDAYKQAITDNIGASGVKMAETYLSYTEGFNLSNLVMFATNLNCTDMTAVATLSDAETVKKNLKDFCGEAVEEDGFTVYTLEGSKVAIKGNMIWFASKLGTITKHIENAQDGNIASIAPLNDVATGDNAFAMAYSLPELKSQLNKNGEDLQKELEREGLSTSLAGKIAGIMDYYACFSIKFDKNTMQGEAYLANKDGKRNEFGKIFNVINTDCLKNAPAGTNFIAACGDIADPDIKKIINENAAEMGNAADILTQWDGTAAIAVNGQALTNANPVDLMKMSENDMMQFIMNNVKFIIMGHYPSATISKFAGQINDQLTAGGMTPENAGAGRFSANMQGMTLYWGNDNGYFSFSNFAPGSGDNALASYLEGRRFSIVGKNEPNPTAAKFGYDFGSTSNMWLDTDAVKFITTLDGTDKNFLQAFIEPLTNPANIQALMEFAQEVNGAIQSKYMDYGYSYDWEYDEFQPDDFEAEIIEDTDF